MSPLWGHQVQAIIASTVLKDLGLFFEQGTGKTRTMIEVLRRKYAEKNKLRKTLILCPVIVCENWRREFKMYSKIAQKDIVVLTGSGASRIKKFVEEVGQDLTKEKIIVTNYEAMQMEDFYKLIMMWNPEILVCDESQRLKNPESKRAKAVVRLADISQHNYTLTGTPILNSAMDVYMQFRVLDRGETFGKNFYGFRNAYFMDANQSFKSKQHYFPKWEERPETYEILQSKIKTKAIRVLKKDCLDLPPFVRQSVSVSLSKEQAKAYREIYNDFITWVESKSGEPRAVVANLAIVKALRLQQIVTGFVNDENGNPHRLPCPRIDALEEIIEGIDPKAKIIIWCAFKENYKQVRELCEKIGRGYRELHGEVSHADREKNLQAFREDPEVTVMIANQAAAGLGVNLIEASYAVYYSKSFRLEDDLQSEARNYRGGSEMHAKVTRIDLVCAGSIDELINESLAKKQAIGDSILSWKEQIKI
jgi:SNF2 family DNA or RNA helicase